jgi:hypothetical protein
LDGGNGNSVVGYIRFVPDNWGSVKGGKNKIKIHGINLTKADRVKGGKNIPKDPKRLRMISHLGFLKSTKRKFLGPKGELVFNELEKKVAETLHANGIDYVYEPIISLGKNFVSPDFLLEGKVIIECTEWTDITEKSFLLKTKIKRLVASKIIKRAIVVTNQSLLRGYQKSLKETAAVTTLEHFIQVLKRG